MGFALIALKFAPFIMGAIQAVEHFLASKRGRDKQDAAVDMVSNFLIATEGIVGRNLMNDNDVREATRTVIDAVVALQNLVTRKVSTPDGALGTPTG